MSERKIVEHHVVMDAHPVAVSDKVNDLIAQGCQPCGHMLHIPEIKSWREECFVQPMVRYEEPTDDEA